ncbi:MAG: CBS domain-containing protein [Polyangiaceae bacterium]
MSSPVCTCPSDVTAGVAAEQMREKGLMHLVVVDARGCVVGVVSDRDLRAAQPSALLVRDEKLREKALSLLRVQDVMSSTPHTVHPGSTVRAALMLMKRHRVGSLPVVDPDGLPVGILTHGDVIEMALALLR